MKKKALASVGIILIATFILCFVAPVCAIEPVFVKVFTADGGALKAGQVFSASPSQVATLTSQAGVQVTSTMPAAQTLAQSNMMALQVAGQGGAVSYVVGSPATLATGLNAAGVTTGMTASGLAAGGFGVGAAGVAVAATGATAVAAGVAVIAGAAAAGSTTSTTASSHTH